MIPNRGIWWSPMARRVALASLVVAVLSLGLSSRNPGTTPTGPNQIAAAFLTHELQSAE